MKYLFKPLVAALLAGILVTSAGLASQKSQEPADSFPNHGILVDRIKMYSDADLRERFRDLARQLSPLLGIDPSKIYEGLFTVQGIEAARSNQAVNFTTTPIPKVEDIIQTNFPPDKDPATGKKTTATQSEQSANVPNTSSLAGTLNGPTSITQGSLDRLSEYTQLFYETINLQMLLNRAISDTVNSDVAGARVLRPRVPVIFGLPVSLMAQPSTQGAMAQIWVTVTPRDHTNRMPINVITQIPQERTYNVSTVTNDIRSVGLGAVTTLLNFGFSDTRQREKLYLVKSYDTVSISSFNGSRDNDGAEFGWQVRPVLGNKSVTPGKRTFMVALSLPPANNQALCVKVTTQWFRYDKKTGTIKEPITAAQTAYETTVQVNTRLLSPSLNAVTFNAGAANAIETRLTGNGFTPDLPYYSGGRRVAVSSTTDDRGSVQLTLNKDDLLTNDFQAGTMFGGLAPLQSSLLQWNGNVPYDKLQTLSAEAWEQSDDTYKVRMQLDGDWRCLTGQCVVQIGDNFSGYELKDRPAFFYDATTSKTFSNVITVPAKDFAANKTVILAAPFCAFVHSSVPHDDSLNKPYPAVRASTTVRSPNLHLGFAVSDVKKTGKGGTEQDPYTIFTITGRGLRDIEITVPAVLDGVGREKRVTNMRLDVPAAYPIRDQANRLRQLFRQLNGDQPNPRSDKIVLVPVYNSALDKTQNIIISKKLENPIPSVEEMTKVQPLELPAKKPDDVKVKSIDDVKLNHVGAVTVHGATLARVKKVLIGKDEVKFVGPETVPGDGPDGKERVWYLVLPAALTKTAGTRSVIFILDDDSVITKSFTVAN